MADQAKGSKTLEVLKVVLLPIAIAVVGGAFSWAKTHRVHRAGPTGAAIGSYGRWVLAQEKSSERRYSSAGQKLRFECGAGSPLRL